MPKCEVCGAYMNPVEAMFGNVCGKCVKKRHREATS